MRKLISRIPPRFLLFVATCLSMATAKASETAYTAPRGIYTVKVPGAAQPGVPVRTYLGIQLLPDKRFVGRANVVSGNSVSFLNSPDLTYFADPDRKSYLHVLDGAGKGFVTDIEEFRSNDIVCAEPLASWIQFYTQVQIRPHSNLADVMGADNPFGLASAPDADSADNVVVWDPDAQQERVYYFHSTRFRWEEKGIVADASLAIFRFPYGFYIVRRSPGTLRIKLEGDSALDSVLLPARPGANVFSLPINLSGSLDAMVATDGGFPVVSGQNAGSADILTFEEPTTGQQRGPFYHLSSPGSSGWREIGVNDSTTPIQPLDFLSTLILRRNGDAGRIFVEGSLDPPLTPRPTLPPDPEPGETPLSGELVIPRQLTLRAPNISYTLEISDDLQNWSPHSSPSMGHNIEGNGDWHITFELPSGQRRAFYRLNVTLGF